MCKICEQIETVKNFESPMEYINTLKYIQKLVDSGKFQFRFLKYETDKVLNEDGKWVDDVITHKIECKTCGQIFNCTAITYHGGGSFEIED